MEESFAQIDALIDRFEPISLKEMDSVKLMNRTDTKFTFNVRRFPAVLSKLLEYYKVLEISGIRKFRYQSIYFDTTDFKMFHDHRMGRPNRVKIRRREYLDSGLNFMEVKVKNGQGRTIKERIKKSKHEHHFTDETVSFLVDTCPFESSKLHPALVNSFSRITFVHKTEQERLTIDLNLSFVNSSEKKKELPYLVIAEVKRDGTPYSSSFIKIMREQGMRQSSMSKYCIGTILLNPDIKHNTFKPKLIQLNKIKNDTGGNS